MNSSNRRQTAQALPSGDVTNLDPVAVATPIPRKQLLKRKTVEAEFDIPQATLATMATRGGGPRFIKLGRRVYYHRDEIERWLSSRRK